MGAIGEYQNYGGNSGVSGRLMRLLDNLNLFLEGETELHQEKGTFGNKWFVLEAED